MALRHLFILLLGFQSFAFSADWLIYVPPEKNIPELKWILRKDAETGRGIIKGILNRTGWELEKHDPGFKSVLNSPTGLKFVYEFEVGKSRKQIDFNVKKSNGEVITESVVINGSAWPAFVQRVSSKHLTPMGFWPETPEATFQTFRPKTWWAFFRASLLSSFDSLGGNSTSGQFAWHPKIPVHLDPVVIRAGAGLSYLKSSTNDRFLAIEYGVFPTITVYQGLQIFLGAGGQSWLSRETSAFASVGLSVLVNARWPRQLSEVFVRYTNVFSTNRTQIAQFGVGFAF